MRFTIGTSVLVGQIGGNYILPYIPLNSSFVGYEKLLLNPALTGRALVLALKLYDENTLKSTEYGQTFLLGAGSHIGTDYIVGALNLKYNIFFE
jgi:hypothetical protein